MRTFAFKPIPLITWGDITPQFEDHNYFQHVEHFPFHPRTRRFNIVNAWWLSEAALIAYTEENFATAGFQSAGFNTIRFFTGHSTQCYVAANSDFALTAFRGTEFNTDGGPEAMAQFMADLSADIDIRWVPAPQNGKIHRGFSTALDEIWPQLCPHLVHLAQKGAALWFTGHSLGGALAALAADRIKNAQGLYTFGAPRIGNRDFAAKFPLKSFRLVNNNDIVPHLPTFPYTHLGELRYIDSDGILHHNLTRWELIKDKIRGHIKCVEENLNNINRGLTATLVDGIKDHTPLLYALHLWNNVIRLNNTPE